MSEKLKGRNAVITGASKGLGRAMALALAADGAGVALVSRNREQLEGVAAQIAAAGGVAGVFQADVTNEEQVRGVEREIVARFGKVNILINNAGINVRKPVTDFTLEEWRSVVDTSLTAAFLMCRSFVPHMTGQGYGRIVNMTSIMSWVSLPGRAAYSAGKAGLLGMTRALALELAPEGITANGISPGPFATEMNRPLMENAELNAQFLAGVPLGRWGKVEEIGQLAVYLCSDDAGFITGTDILIDGGWCAR
ncbi:MAG TPA: SDR family NAD(P)-dependent oxidoreductase [Candidatus Acidoferrales bacterium]|nr:SDR family NAD(P)-dependent oxidoreductase [Candidatus Acidoferrales bacterium]